jgi:hypothetical protein
MASPMPFTVSTMRQAYLLDTSAFRALSGTILKNLRGKGYILLGSPYVFWELICHLDEAVLNFERRKGQLMKFEFVDCLDDPRSNIEMKLLPSKYHERVSDAELIHAVLRKLKGSSSLATFYSSYIEDSKKRIRRIAECAHVARETLEREQQKYRYYVENIVELLSLNQMSLATARDQHERILSSVDGYMRVLEGQGTSDTDLNESIIRHTYIYYSYIIHRAMNLCQNGNTIPPANDYEDGRMCLHLTLGTSYNFVTDDAGTVEALKGTLSLLTRLDDPEFKTTCEVYDSDYLRNLAY